jgi:hypothetical protein
MYLQSETILLNPYFQFTLRGPHSVIATDYLHIYAREFQIHNIVIMVNSQL